MRKWTGLFLIALLAVALGPLCPATRGQTLISVNFQGKDAVALAPTDSTGSVPGTNWNNVAGASGGPVVLNDSTGAPSALTLTSYTAGPFGADGGNSDNSTPQKILYNGGLNVNFGNANFVLSGLSAFSSYDLIVDYSAGTSFPDQRHTNITASGSTNTYYAAGIQTVLTAFTQSNSTTAGTYAQGNYVVFSGLTAGSETVTMAYVNNSLTLAGFQVVGTPAPEPASIGLLSLGGMGLLARRHRRRA